MVQRYFPDVEGSMISDDSGGWVAHDDYAALDAEYEELLNAVISYGYDPETLIEWVKEHG